jgi:hypothetical protein
MDKLMGLSKGQKLVVGGGLLLFIDTFLPWQKVTVGFGGASISATANAWHGFWGVVMCLLVIVMLAWAAVRILGVALPVNAPAGLTTLALGGLILVFALLKTLTESYRGWASWVGLVLAAGVAVGAWFSFQDSGESLPKVATAGAPAPSAPPAEPEKPADPS